MFIIKIKQREHAIWRKKMVLLIKNVRIDISSYARKIVTLHDYLEYLEAALREEF